MVQFVEYGKALTTSIIGLAAEECGRLAYDPDNVFCAEIINDPDFPLTCADNFEESSRPHEILEAVTGANLQVIVNVLELMEKSWCTFPGCSPIRDPSYLDVAEKLWEFARDMAKHHVCETFGEECVGTFEVIGADLFTSDTEPA